MPTLTPPTEDQNLETHDRLFGRYKLTRGLTLLVSGSTVILAQYPDHQDIADGLYDFVYLGGRSYDISDAEAATLTAAGYGAYIT